jgi:tetratricopeptide (TPR) repeat protein
MSFPWRGLLVVAVLMVGSVLVAACGGLNEAEKRYNDGREARDAGRHEEAIALYTEAIDLDPSLAKAYVERGLLLIHQGHGPGRYPKAIADATKAIELQPTDVNVLAAAHFVRANALMHTDFSRADRWDRIIADLTEVIELNTTDIFLLATAHWGRFEALEELGRTDEGIADLQAIIDLPSDRHPLTGRAEAKLAELRAE